MKSDDMAGVRPLELYVHIPFCARKCDYCDFLSFPVEGEGAEEGLVKPYLSKLNQEIRRRSGAFKEYRVTTVFLGGGTPSILEADRIENIMETIRDCFFLSKDAEITLEANPGTLTPSKLCTYKEAGINRISLGLQSADDGELRRLGRIHTYEEFLTSYRLAREEGFSNVNVDLMSALPGQTVASWEDTLGKVTALGPEHISAYSLMVEEGTPFYRLYSGAGASLLPDEEEDRAMYHRTKERLRACGYERYEISNYAKPGRECRHNIGYWTGAEYLGLGLGASSYIGGWRFSGGRDLKQYLNLTEKELSDGTMYGCREQVTKKGRMEEFMFLGLRLMRGVAAREFWDKFHVPIETVYGDILKKLESRGLMEFDGGSWRLSEYGIDLSNYVMSEFLLD